MSQINKIQIPSLPYASNLYHPAVMDQYSNVLRLYFTQLNGAMNNLIGTNGGQFVDCPNGLFFNTADQTFAATNTAYPVVFNQTYLSNAVALRSGSTSEIEVTIGGVYNFQYSGQLLSTSASSKDVFLWIKRNDVNIGYSTHAYTLTGNNQYKEVNWNFNIDLAAGEYIELEIASTSTNVRLDAVAPTSPHPGISSSVMTVNFVGPLPAVRPTAP
jgi:hypothetical protein